MINLQTKELINLLSEFLPQIFEFIGKSNSRLKPLEKFEKRYNNLILNYNETDIIQNHCIVENVAYANKGCEISKLFLSYIDNLFVKTLPFVKKELYDKYRGILINMVTSFDTDVTLKNNPTYLNFLGELLSLNEILKIKEYEFELQGIEYLLVNNRNDNKKPTDADFLFYSKKNKKEYLVEVMNIHYIDLSKFNTKEKLRNHLYKKIEDKIEKKTKDINSELNILKFNNKEYNFFILPIIWEEPSKLILYKDIFEEFNSNFENILPFMHFYRNIDNMGNSEYLFIKYSEILNHLNNE